MDRCRTIEALQREFMQEARRLGAAQATVEAFMLGLRKRGLAALAEPDTERRLSELSPAQIKQCMERIVGHRPRYPGAAELLDVLAEFMLIVEQTPPDTWEGLSRHLLNVILDEIEGGLPDGNRYSDAATAGDREAWRVICRHAPQKTDKQAREVIRIWVRNGVLVKKPYNQPQSRKTRQGLHVDNSKRSS